MPTPEQQALAEAIARVLEEDAQVEAVWLAGSLGYGGGDRFSDVDMLALCADGAAGKASAFYQQQLSRIADPIIVNALFGGRVVNVVGVDWQRFDVTFIEGAQLGMYDAGKLTVLFNRSGREPPRPAPQPYRTSPDVLLKLVTEFFRVQGLASVGLGRREYVVSLAGIELLRRMTADLMLEERGIAPADRGGVLHLNRLLDGEQRLALESLPPLAPTDESIRAANQALAALFLPRARKLAAQIGMAWPEKLESATRAHLMRTLGLEL